MWRRLWNTLVRWFRGGSHAEYTDVTYVDPAGKVVGRKREWRETRG